MTLKKIFSEKIEKIKKILGSWSTRKLTLLGKIAVLKSLAVSQIVLSSLAIPRGVMNEVNSLLYNFLWDGKSDKIKRTGRAKNDQLPKLESILKNEMD